MHLKKGGALETVLENRNKIEESSGLFFEEQTEESLQNTLNYFEKNRDKFKPEWIRNYSSKFREQEFLKNMTFEIGSFLEDRKKNI